MSWKASILSVLGLAILAFLIYTGSMLLLLVAVLIGVAIPATIALVIFASRFSNDPKIEEETGSRRLLEATTGCSPNEVKCVETRGGKFVHFLMVNPTLRFKKEGNPDQPGYWEIIEGRGGYDFGLFRGTFYRLSGGYHLYVPFFQRVKQHPFVRTVEEVVVDKATNRTEVVPVKKISFTDHGIVVPMTLHFERRNIETADEGSMVKCDVFGNFEYVVRNPMRYFTNAQTWLPRLEAAIDQVVKDFVSDKKYSDVQSSKDAMPTEIIAKTKALCGEIGIVITAIKVRDVQDSGSETVRKAQEANFIAGREADALRTRAKGEADAIRTRAEAEGKREEIVREAQGTGDARGLEQVLSAAKKFEDSPRTIGVFTEIVRANAVKGAPPGSIVINNMGTKEGSGSSSSEALLAAILQKLSKSDAPDANAKGAQPDKKGGK
jgi:regulator of protease activity HflC (stomatin/prohibitin superfamily)/uncharacterized protein YneF (UPF0154 family)